MDRGPFANRSSRASAKPPSADPNLLKLVAVDTLTALDDAESLWYSSRRNCDWKIWAGKRAAERHWSWKLSGGTVVRGIRSSLFPAGLLGVSQIHYYSPQHPEPRQTDCTS